MNRFAKKLTQAERDRKSIAVFALGDGTFSTVPRWKKDRTGERIYTHDELLEIERDGFKVVRLEEVHDWRTARG